MEDEACERGKGIQENDGKGTTSSNTGVAVKNSTCKGHRPGLTDLCENKMIKGKKRSAEGTSDRTVGARLRLVQS